MGEYRVSRGDDVLTALGLGSCVAVGLVDTESSRCGLAHVMLPAEEGENSKKHADVLINRLVESMKKRGSDPENLKAKIFGGASMFHNSFDIGEENIESVKEELDRRDIDIVEEDTGGESGRAIWLSCRSGNVVVRKSFEGTETVEDEE